MSDKIFKCPNDLNVTVKQDGGEVKLQEDCCTGMVILLKNDGDMATSFYGYHNPQIIKTLIKAQKKYFRSLKKRLKLESIEDNIEIKNEDIPEDKKWDESKTLKEEKNTQTKETKTKEQTNKKNTKKKPLTKKSTKSSVDKK